MPDKYNVYNYSVKDMTTKKVRFYKNRAYAQKIARESNHACCVFGYGKPPLNTCIYERYYI